MENGINIPLIEHKVNEVTKKVDGIAEALTKNMDTASENLAKHIDIMQSKLGKIGETLIELKTISAKDQEATQKQIIDLYDELKTHSKSCPLNPSSIKNIVKADIQLISNELSKEFLNKEQIEDVIALKVSELPMKWTKNWAVIVAIILNLGVIGGLIYSAVAN